jgi:predicted peroxiredoxin
VVGGDKVVINLTTGLEDPERVAVAFLFARAALRQGMRVATFLTRDAVRLGLPGHADGAACDGYPPLARLLEEYAERGGELFLCPASFDARGLDKDLIVGNAKVAGATPLMEWIGEGAAIFSY